MARQERNQEAAIGEARSKQAGFGCCVEWRQATDCVLDDCVNEAKVVDAVGLSGATAERRVPRRVVARLIHTLRCNQRETPFLRQIDPLGHLGVVVYSSAFEAVGGKQDGHLLIGTLGPAGERRQPIEVLAAEPIVCQPDTHRLTAHGRGGHRDWRGGKGR
eukprot:scaffold276763_cov30-Tisochrysis_lutea.AAC.2